MSEYEMYEKYAGDPASNGVLWSDLKKRYLPMDGRDPDSVNAADCWNWGLSSWKARADLAANSLLEDVRNLELPEGEAFPFSFWVHLGDVGCKYIRADLAAERGRELVEAAYREGHSDGVRACSAQHQTPTDVVDLDWFESRARSGLYKEQLDEQGSDADG